MTDPEKEIQNLENEFPHSSSSAFTLARKKALSSGLSVVQSENGKIVRVYPDGRKEFLKNIEAPTSAKPGQVFPLRRAS